GGLACESGARRPGAAAEDVPAGRVERVERGEPTACEQCDRASEPPPDPLAQHLPRGEQLRGALRLEPQQPAQLLRRPVERRVAERAPVLRRQGDPPELEVSWHV